MENNIWPMAIVIKALPVETNTQAFVNAKYNPLNSATKGIFFIPKSEERILILTG